MTIKKRNKAESQNRILQAGLAVFSKYGYDAATTKMIAARAGLNESLIQRYFKSKSGLLVAVNKLSLQAMLAQTPYPPQTDVESEIFQFMQSKMERDGDNLAFVRVILSRILIDEKLREEMRKQTPPPKRIFLHERLELFKENGLIADDVAIEELVGIIMSQSFIVGLLERIMFHKTKQDCSNRFRVFARAMAKGIAP
ncbi:MAG: helix-turn-helix domain-containing protein [Elusimicrobiaceae bacterium]|jgi:AcrR family transcriptional regulator